MDAESPITTAAKPQLNTQCARNFKWIFLPPA